MIVVRYLITAIQSITAVLMLVAVVVNAANIAGRYIFFRPIASAEEVMLFLMVGVVFFGNAIVGYENKSLRMDVFINALPKSLHRLCDVAADVTMIAVCVTLIVIGWPAIQMLAEFDQRSEAAEIPLVIPQALVPIGLGLNAILVAVRMIASWCNSPPVEAVKS